MGLYSTGDAVICKIGYGKVLLADDSAFELAKEFSIACPCDNGYLILLPSDLYLQCSFVLNVQDCKDFGLPKKFVGGTVHYITDDHVLALRNRMTGLSCMKCHEYFEYAEVNRIDENGKGALICWHCRMYPHYK